MKKTILNLVVAAATFSLMSTSLQTQAKPTDIMMGGMLNHAIYSGDGIDEFALSAYTIRMGIETLPNQTIEYRFSKGLTEESVSGIEYELDKLFGIYYNVNYQFSKNYSAYAIAGFSSIKLDKTVDDVEENQSHIMGAYGLGFKYKLAKDANINIEAMMYADGDIKYSAAGAGIELVF